MSKSSNPNPNTDYNPLKPKDKEKENETLKKVGELLEKELNKKGKDRNPEY